MNAIPELYKTIEIAGNVVSPFGSSKIRYASTLVLGRYASWTSKHPQCINDHLDIIYKGFSGGQELSSASALALKYLCETCGVNLI